MCYTKIVYLVVKNFLHCIYRFIRTQLTFATLQLKYKNCIIASTSKINNSILCEHVVLFDNVILDNCFIGSHSYIQKNSSVFNSTIGKFCSIASNVTIAPGFHSIFGVSTHPAFYLKNTPLSVTFADKDYYESKKNVIIGNDVWIGINAIILDGVSIGTGSIIAAGAVVVKDVAPYSIVGGVPAKHIKYRFDEEIIDIIQKSEWWNFSDEWFKQNAEVMMDIRKFIKAIKK